MTGYGAASGENPRFSLHVELKSVNNRYLKVTSRLPDQLAPFEQEFERLVRDVVTRGTVSVSVRLTAPAQSGRFRLDTQVIAGYCRQLRELTDSAGFSTERLAAQVLALPGVVVDSGSTLFDSQSDWPFVESVFREALAQFREFRVREGAAMELQMRQCCDTVSTGVGRVEVKAPVVVTEYRDKLLERVRGFLSAAGVPISTNDLLREVSLYADRCDINEEITRLKCHIEQFERMIAGGGSQGRKLDFLSQEMFREVNTMGSKASDIEISHVVVEMKAAVETLREILQNVE